VSLDVLAIAAHPDDIEQTCGGTLIRMAEAGYRVGALDLTAGDMGTRGTPEQRVEESECAGRHMLLSWRGNLHFPDARLENTISARMTLAVKIRELKPRVVILPYWQARHPDPQKILYSSLYADVKPSFIVDISGQFERRMTALLSYVSQYGEMAEGGALFPSEQEIRERLGAIARFYGNQIGVKYGEPFVVKEAMQIDDIVAMPVRSI
jgi:LmbE family N-acetylglucosaminyl deacetylase